MCSISYTAGFYNEIYIYTSFIFLLAIATSLHCMEDDSVVKGYSVSPNALGLNPDLLVRPSFAPTIEKKYAHNGNRYNAYYKACNNLMLIEVFCQSNNTTTKRNPTSIIVKDEYNNVLKHSNGHPFERRIIEKNDTMLALLPLELQINILEYCNLYPDKLYNPYIYNNDSFGFRGFLNLECSIYVTFHFKDFDVQQAKDNFNLKISLKDANDTLNLNKAHKVVSILQKNQLIPNSLTCLENKLNNLNQKNSKNCVLPLSNCQKMLGFPFTTAPLFPQKIFFYGSAHFGDQYLQPKLCTSFITQPLLNVLNQDWYVISFYCSIINQNEKMFFVELMDETITGENQVHPSEIAPPQNHQIIIFKSCNNDTEFTKIQTIELPVIQNYIYTDYYSLKPFSNARFSIENIFNNIIVLYDRKYYRYACFTLPKNKSITYEALALKDERTIEDNEHTDHLQKYFLNSIIAVDIALFLFIINGKRSVLCNTLKSLVDYASNVIS